MTSLSEKQLNMMIPMTKYSVSKIVVGDLFIVHDDRGYLIYEIKRIIDKKIEKRRLIVDLYSHNDRRFLSGYINMYNIIYKDRYILYKSITKKINKIMQL